MKDYQLTEADKAALDAFAAAKGKKWRNILAQEYWPKARIWERNADQGCTLHALRNRGGFRLIKGYKPSEQVA